MNTELVLPLEKMTIDEKMDVIDQVMDDLSRNAAAIPEIAWHGDVLRGRQERMENGTNPLFSLDEAVKYIRERTGRR